jgi:hypothetical protein
MHDRPNPVHRAREPGARGEIADHELDAVAGRVVVPTECANLTPGVAQPWHDEAPERTRAAGNQNR